MLLNGDKKASLTEAKNVINFINLFIDRITLSGFSHTLENSFYGKQESWKYHKKFTTKDFSSTAF